MHNRIKIVLVRSIDKLRHRCKCSGELRMPSYPRLLGAMYGVLKGPAPDAEASSGVVDCGLWLRLLGGDVVEAHGSPVVGR